MIRATYPTRCKRVLGVAALAVLFLAIAGPTKVVACIGGSSFASMVGWTKGDIVIGNVRRVEDLPSFAHDLDIAVTDIARGAPRDLLSIEAFAGMVCDQHATVGDRVVVLVDVRGTYPSPAIYYVIDAPGGPDTAELQRFTDRFAAPPATDVAAASASVDPPVADRACPLAFLILLGGASLLIAGRYRRSRSTRRQ